MVQLNHLVIHELFGMGLTLSAGDFKEVFRRPKDVAIGGIGQFLIMPVLAFLLAKGLQLPPEIAVGVILVGCCPGGTSSNVMTFLAKGDVPLSVTITSVTTLLAPVVTPALILLLASEWIPVDPASLFVSIVKIVIIPIVLGGIIKKLFNRQAQASVKVLQLVSIIPKVPSYCKHDDFWLIVFPFACTQLRHTSSTSFLD